MPKGTNAALIGSATTAGYLMFTNLNHCAGVLPDTICAVNSQAN